MSINFGSAKEVYCTQSCLLPWLWATRRLFSSSPPTSPLPSPQTLQIIGKICFQSLNLLHPSITKLGFYHMILMSFYSLFHHPSYGYNEKIIYNYQLHSCVLCEDSWEQEFWLLFFFFPAWALKLWAPWTMLGIRKLLVHAVYVCAWAQVHIHTYIYNHVIYHIHRISLSHVCDL